MIRGDAGWSIFMGWNLITFFSLMMPSHWKEATLRMNPQLEE